MAEEEDILAREVVIGARLEENGIALRAKSRAVAALDRLVGSLLDLPTAFFEGHARKRRLKAEIEERLRRVQFEIAERRLGELTGSGDQLLLDVLQDKARRQTNLAGVAVEAIDALQALPKSPNHPSDGTASFETASDRNSGAGAAGHSGAGEEAAEIDDDWMNQFARFAEDASSERLQQVWGRVLAGEINRPGTFSRHTLRFIAELDQETARNCEFAASRAIGTFIPKTDEWNSGQGLQIGLDLQRLGLIEGIGTFGLNQNFTVGAGGSVGVLGRKYALDLNGEPGTKVSVEAVMLTRMGREVFSLLDTSDEVAAMEALADRFAKEGLRSIVLGTLGDADARGTAFHPLRSVWSS
ncbi:MAG TPA: DUF2806 domain-containing protein [Allosphingosinicella sp.]|jgi:hypothetical protein